MPSLILVTIPFDDSGSYVAAALPIENQLSPISFSNLEPFDIVMGGLTSMIIIFPKV
jgi:hypothetical protein